LVLQAKNFQKQNDDKNGAEYYATQKVRNVFQANLLIVSKGFSCVIFFLKLYC